MEILYGWDSLKEMQRMIPVTYRRDKRNIAAHDIVIRPGRWVSFPYSS